MFNNVDLNVISKFIGDIAEKAKDLFTDKEAKVAQYERVSKIFAERRAEMEAAASQTSEKSPEHKSIIKTVEHFNNNEVNYE